MKISKSEKRELDKFFSIDKNFLKNQLKLDIEKWN